MRYIAAMGRPSPEAASLRLKPASVLRQHRRRGWHSVVRPCAAFRSVTRPSPLPPRCAIPVLWSWPRELLTRLAVNQALTAAETADESIARYADPACAKVKGAGMPPARKLALEEQPGFAADPAAPLP